MNNTGVYALYWWDYDLVYVGLSQDLSRRKSEHYYHLVNNKHSNYKVQLAYSNHGLPDFIILEYCKLEDLPKKEIFWSGEFNAVNNINALGIVEPGVVGFGTNSNGSKYSKFQILKVFSLLYKNSISYTEIAKRTNTNKSLVQDIANSRTHLWIREVYPHQYAKMLDHKDRAHRKHRENIKAILIHEDGRKYQVFSIKDFCREILGNVTFSSSISRLIKGTRKSCKGFSVFNN